MGDSDAEAAWLLRVEAARAGLTARDDHPDDHQLPDITREMAR